MSENLKNNRCDSCGGLFTDDEIIDLSETPDLALRLDPGGEVPSGECKECGALCYLTEDEPDEAAEMKIGQTLAEVLKLRKTPNRRGYQTEWGWKTPLGIYRTVARIMAGETTPEK